MLKVDFVLMKNIALECIVEVVVFMKLILHTVGVANAVGGLIIFQYTNFVPFFSKKNLIPCFCP